MPQFNDLLGRIFEHEGTYWRVTKVGTPSGFAWSSKLYFEPAEYQQIDDEPGFEEAE